MARKKLVIPAKTYKIPGKTIHRKAWIDRYGHRHPASTYVRPAQTIERKRHKRPDVGALGRTPESKKWFEPKFHSGWRKEDTASTRRRIILNTTKKQMKEAKYPKWQDPYLLCARRLTSLANVSTDAETKKKAKEDADYFYEKAETHPGGVKLPTRKGKKGYYKKPVYKTSKTGKRYKSYVWIKRK
jgi:hypothetical protein